MKSEPKRCPYCDAKMVEHKHGLSKGLLRCLVKLAKAGHGDQNLNDLGMNYSQQSNFQKLKYWGIVEKADPNCAKGGEWRITERGWSFVKGEIALQKSVFTYRGAVVGYEGKKLLIEEITGGWKWRPDYARDERSHVPPDQQQLI